VTTTAPTLSALVLGATGLVGRRCLDLLLGDEAYGRVVVLARKPPRREHPKLRWHVTDLARVHEYGHLLGVDDVFCCLGTTIRAAGSREAFYEVDFEHVVRVARATAESGARQLLLVSALGADAHSRVFYNRIKGEAERAIRELPLRGTQIFRPSLLLGQREEFRLGERLAALGLAPLLFLLIGKAKKYRPVPATAVAEAMVRVAKLAPAGVNVFESDRIVALAAA